jgi:hypothetical protein
MLRETRRASLAPRESRQSASKPQIDVRAGTIYQQTQTDLFANAALIDLLVSAPKLACISMQIIALQAKNLEDRQLSVLLLL